MFFNGKWWDMNILCISDESDESYEYWMMLINVVLRMMYTVCHGMDDYFMTKMMSIWWKYEKKMMEKWNPCLPPLIPSKSLIKASPIPSTFPSPFSPVNVRGTYFSQLYLRHHDSERGLSGAQTIAAQCWRRV